MKKEQIVVVGIVVVAILLLLNLLIPDPIPFLDEATMVGALLWLIRQKTTLSEENNKVVDVSVEDDDFRPGDPPKLTSGK